MRGTTSRTLGLLIVVGLGHCVPTALGTDRAVPNDPAFLCQWGLENTGQLADCDVPIPAGRIEADIDALGAWSMHTGAKPIIVAVLGQGISPHPEFENRLLPGFATIGDPYDTWDLGERGSLVAGIIAAGRDNGMGVAGLNDAVRLLPVRVFNANSATTQSAQAQGVRWAVDQGAEIIVVLSQLVAGSDVFAEAIAYAAANDVLILAAAGDDGTGDQVYPAAYAECIGVAATTNTDARAPFSNSGAHVDL